MKIGIVTFFCVPNYGAMLQACALWKYLEERGHEVEFIDYAFGNTRRIPLWKCFVARHLHNCIDVIRKKFKSYVRFDIVSFSDAFPRTRRFESFSELKTIGNKYDAIIVGSDQMWNPVWCSGQHLPVVMLDFAHEGVKRIAYAASFGTRVWTQDQRAELAGELLKKFNAISVREESGVGLVRRLSCRDDAKWVLDPTLLHQAEFYSGLESRRKKTERYLFSYILDEWTEGVDIPSIIKTVKSVKGIDSTCTDRIDVRGMLAPICMALKVQNKVAVSEWLALIENADFVVTNSFHGTVFSIIFHIPFVSILTKGALSGMNERLISILKIVNLEYRALNSNDESEIRSIVTKPIDWYAVDEALGAKRAETRSFFELARM